MRDALSKSILLQVENFFVMGAVTVKLATGSPTRLVNFRSHHTSARTDFARFICL